MPTSLPVPTKNPGDILTSTLWNSYLRDNVNKLLNTGHRVLTVAQFAALTLPEGTKGTVAPDEVYLEVDATNGVLWHLAYESGEPTYKWRFLGGSPLYSEVLAAETTTSATYTDLATIGPSIIAPRAGNYEIFESAGIYSSSGGGQGKAAVKIGSAATSDNEGIANLTGAAGPGVTAARSMIRLAAASDTLKMQYAMPGGSVVGYLNRNLQIRPVRIS